jgi:streptomycin 6-kinase
MEPTSELPVALQAARARAESLAREWGLTLGTPFEIATASFVASADDHLVLKVPSEGGDESLHEGDALELCGSDIAVRIIQRDGRALLEERVVPGTDLSALDDHEATAIAVELAGRLWRREGDPIRPVDHDVARWLTRAERRGSTLVGLARDLHGALGGRAEWLVHGDFHHHNILRDGSRYVVIDPKPCLSDREYDVASFLWNPMENTMRDHEQTERRISAFVAEGLDEYRIRAWAVIRGAYLRPEFALPLRALME